MNKWVSKPKQEVVFDLRVKNEWELSSHQFGEEGCSKCREPHEQWHGDVSCLGSPKMFG